MYVWVQLRDEPGKDVLFMKRVYDGKIHFGETEDFYFMEKYDPKDKDDVNHFKMKYGSDKEPPMQLKKGRIRKVKIFFTTYDDDTVYQEAGEDEELMGFRKDQDKKRLILLIRTGHKKSVENIEPRRYLFKVFDEEENAVIQTIVITDPRIIGIMTTG